MADDASPRRLREVAAISALALALTLVIAAPVLFAPSERLFGRELVGRHHDPFTVMAQLTRPLTPGTYPQPVTDLAGALLASALGPVGAYNWLVLLSFPLAAAAAYLLARHLGLSPGGSAVAAIAYAFSPFHLAHAAYHPHVAQVQWIPLYLLALWRCVERPGLPEVAALAAAAAAVTLSNFYGGLIAAALTPVFVAVHWALLRRRRPGSGRSLIVTCGALLAIAAGGLLILRVTAPAVLADPASLAFPRRDLFRYGARWWSYLVPPLGHPFPFLEGIARAVWSRARVDQGVLEQQVSLGWGVLALGAVAFFHWLSREGRTQAVTRVPLLGVVACAAALCSLSPERRIGGLTFVRPSALIYEVLPMFRAYARFGVVVQLMAALAAGIGAERLLASGSRVARAACAALLLLVAVEYLPWPPQLWRDVLPTRAHRYVAEQAAPMRVLDCVRPSLAEDSVPWLTGKPLSFLGGALPGCTQPDLPARLAAAGYTHLLVRRDTAAGRWYEAHPAPRGLTSVARFPDGEVFAVAARETPR